MKRVNRHKIKHEKPETSSALSRVMEEHDLAYYIHDRVELMHQVFSVLKGKDIRAMAPECVRRLTIDDLQELCTEELLGISSKRLLATLDGAEPPSDTESSSQSSEHVEAISLDSISSDEEILSQGNKKKRKHKRRDSKSKKHKSKKPEEPQGDQEKSKASRAGLTVLELLELQARARAIRAQLQQEQAKRSEAVQSTVVKTSESSTSDVEVKEEQPEVVEIISSDDEKPQIQLLENAVTSNNKEPEKANISNNTASKTPENKDCSKSKKKKDKTKKKDKKHKEPVEGKGDKIDKGKEPDKIEADKIEEATDKRKDSTANIENESNTTKTTSEDNRVTKRVNDLIITVPQQTTRKIKLNRKKMTVSIANNAESEVDVVETTRSIVSLVARPEKAKVMASVVSRPKNMVSVVKAIDNTNAKQSQNSENVVEKTKNKDKSKKKLKKREKRQSIDEDHDEITLQLSDSEKMDLLENFDKRNYEDVSSSSDSESSSDSNDDSVENKDASKELEKSNNEISLTDISLNKASCNFEEDAHDNSNADVDKTSVNDIENSNNFSSTDTPESDKKTDNDEVNTAGTIEISNEQDKNSSYEVYKEQSKVNDPDINTNTDKSFEDNIAEEETIKSQSPKNQSNEEPEASINVPTKQDDIIEISKINDIPIHEESDKEIQNNSDTEKNAENNSKYSQCKESYVSVEDEKKSDDVDEKKSDDVHEKKSGDDDDEKKSDDDDEKKSDDEKNSDDNEHNDANSCVKTSEEERSEGELSDRESSEVEAFEIQPEVVCISDEEAPKKKKKKDKKSKKEKKKKSVFRESADQNFYKDSIDNPDIDQFVIINQDVKDEPVVLDHEVDDDVYEILELSDDSSCYEVEGTTLSKEPTVEEIAALSAKIDEIGTIEREDVVTEQEIQMHEKMEEEKRKMAEMASSSEELENVSWKDRYLDSKKVKRVLTTSNILNALRKKNKELKKKMEESKREKELELQKEEEEKAKEKVNSQEEIALEEGSIEQYNTLEACTRFVDPVPDPIELEKKREDELKEQEMKENELIKEKEKEIGDAIEAQVTGEMKKDAKQLLKMYKKLLKYNDIKKQKDPNKKKTKKKRKKEKDNSISALN